MELPQTTSLSYQTTQRPLVLKKESRHGKCKDDIRPEFRTPEGRKKWNEDCKLRMRKWRAKKPRLRLEPSCQECIQIYKYQKFDTSFGKPHVLKWGFRKDVEDTKLLKIIPNWHLNQKDQRDWSKSIEFYQAGIVLGLENTYWGYRLGCIDIDCRGYTALYKNKSYISNRIGSVHFYFLFKEADMKSKTGKNCVRIKDFKADFKVNGYMMAPLSLHPSGRLYRIRGRGYFYIGEFDKASEAFEKLTKRVEQFQQDRQWKKERRLLKQETKIIQKEKIICYVKKS